MTSVFCTLQKFLNFFGDGEFLPSSTFVKYLAQHFCDTSLDAVCENILFLIAGYDKAGMNEVSSRILIPPLLEHMRFIAC